MQNPTITDFGSHAALLSYENLIFIKTSDHKDLRKARKQTRYSKLLLIPECTTERCTANMAGLTPAYEKHAGHAIEIWEQRQSEAAAKVTSR